MNRYVLYHTEEAASHALPGAETLAYLLQQLLLAVLLGQYVLVGPGISVGNRFPPRGAGDEFR